MPGVSSDISVLETTSVTAPFGSSSIDKRTNSIPSGVFSEEQPQQDIADQPATTHQHYQHILKHYAAMHDSCKEEHYLIGMVIVLILLVFLTCFTIGIRIIRQSSRPSSQSGVRTSLVKRKRESSGQTYFNCESPQRNVTPSSLHEMQFAPEMLANWTKDHTTNEEFNIISGQDDVQHHETNNLNFKDSSTARKLSWSSHPIGEPSAGISSRVRLKSDASAKPRITSDQEPVQLTSSSVQHVAKEEPTKSIMSKLGEEKLDVSRATRPGGMHSIHRRISSSPFEIPPEGNLDFSQETREMKNNQAVAYRAKDKIRRSVQEADGEAWERRASLLLYLELEDSGTMRKATTVKAAEACKRDRVSKHKCLVDVASPHSSLKRRGSLPIDVSKPVFISSLTHSHDRARPGLQRQRRVDRASTSRYTERSENPFVKQHRLNSDELSTILVPNVTK